MSLLNPLTWFRSREKSQPKHGPHIRARYDGAQTTTDNKRLWSGADNLSARAAADPFTRAMLRSRCRFEVENNTYAEGIVDLLATYTVGRGPRLNMELPDNEVLNKTIEREFERWARAVGLSDKLHTMRRTKACDGEVFAFEIENPAIDYPVKLDYKLFEGDQIAFPYVTQVLDERVAVDGIYFDAYGNPAVYSLLKQHPGAMTNSFALEAVPVPADMVIHMFDAKRPSQARGISELAPAIPLFPLLRQYTKATLEAAMSAAYWTAVIHSQLPPDSQGAVQIAEGDWSAFELERNAVMNLPEGWNISQMKPEHPTTQYPQFKQEVLNEIARAVSVPYNLASGNSSNYNYASGRLDWQAFYRSIDVERGYTERVALDRIFSKWVPLAVQAGVIPFVDTTPHSWIWPAFQSIDPMDDAKATETMFHLGLLNEERYWAETYGITMQEGHASLARSNASREASGLPVAGESDASADSQGDSSSSPDRSGQAVRPRN